MKMSIKLILASLVVFCSRSSYGQVLQFGKCSDVQTMVYFDLERFLGLWYEAARFPTWYEYNGACAYKTIQYCGRRIEIEHVYVSENIRYILHVNSTYVPGADAVFEIEKNNIDPVGIPLSVISTDYDNYAIVFGCKNQDDMGLKFISAWILSRSRIIDEEVFQKAAEELNNVPNANSVYLQRVEQDEEKCKYYWTAHISAVTADEQ